MTATYFEHLEFNQKLELIQNDAVYLMSTKKRTTIKDLYSLYSFYVEVIYPISKPDKIVIKGLTTETEIDSYLRLIDISSAIQ
jgi:hypothetical protein